METISSKPVIELDDLSKSYDDVTVVDKVSFSVREGEIFGILGTNGAGKTTTVECLQGLRTADSGRLRVLGLDPLADRKQLRTLVGSQQQDAALPDRLRVGEAVTLFARSAVDPEVVLAPWGLASKLRTSFANLSGGQRQRLFIVLALLNDPKVVFLDELTQGLDPLARRDVWDAIGTVRDHGATVVLVSHLPDEAEALCDRVAVMRGGQIIDTGTPAELIARHAESTTVTFTPPTSFDPQPIRRIAGVVGIEHTGDQWCVRGAATIVAPVCAASLDDRGTGPLDLRVHHPSLDDALLNLFEPLPRPTQPASPHNTERAA